MTAIISGARSAPSLHSALGISVKVKEPLVRGGQLLFELNHELNAYGHEILSVGGFWSATIGLTLRMSAAEDWFEKGLGRQIEVYNQNGLLVWKGFVNQVSLSAGVISEVQGPLMDIGNRASVQYTPMDYTVYPPVSGTQTTTTIAENIASQENYGIIEKVISGGSCMDTLADKIRDVYLEDNSLPQTTGEFSFSPGSAAQVQITLDCLGNVYWLTAYVYNNLGTTLYTVLDKLEAIISADPNHWLSTNWFNLADNAFIVPEMQIGDRFAWDIIQELITLGNDTDDNRRIFGIYEDLIAYYSTIPTTPEYQHYLSDPAQRILNNYNNLVYPWDVRPGKWLIVPDFLAGTIINPGDPIRKDRRLKFLESVRYSAPYNLNLSGGKTDRLSQLLAKITYNGGFL